MNDLISRHDAIDLLLDKGMITAAIYVERIPSAQSNWIPCSEMLPELGLNVLVTTSWNFVTKAMFGGDHWEIESIDYKLSSVVAWMVLPAPWKK